MPLVSFYVLLQKFAMSTGWGGWRNRIEAKQTYARFVLISIYTPKNTTDYQVKPLGLH